MMRQAMLVGVLVGLCVVVQAYSEQGPMPREVPNPHAYPAPLGYVCYPATTPIVLDGKLDDAAWKDIPWSEEFRDIEGTRKPIPRHRTRMKMTWTKEGLYIGAMLDEPHVWGTLTDHDCVIFQDNDFEVFIDPDGDGHVYGELELNALNTTWDLLLTKPYKDGGLAVNGWEVVGLKTAVHVDGTINDARDTDRGWSVEIFWPWQGLRELSHARHLAFPPHDGDQWRINFSRVEWDITIEEGKYRKVPKRPEHNWVWSPQGVIDMHRPERWGVLQFSTQRVGQATLRADPSQPARDYLHRLYYTQQDFRKSAKSYTPSLERLGLPNVPGLSKPQLRTGLDSFEARVLLTLPDGRQQWWQIDQSAMFRRVEGR